MKPIKFKHQNVVFAENQPEYQQLPALKLDTSEGEVISCWKMSFKERLKVLFTGKIWLSLMGFNKPLTPTYLSVNRKDVYSHPGDMKKTKNLKKMNKLEEEKWSKLELLDGLVGISKEYESNTIHKTHIIKPRQKIGYFTPLKVISNFFKKRVKKNETNN